MHSSACLQQKKEQHWHMYKMEGKADSRELAAEQKERGAAFAYVCSSQCGGFPSQIPHALSPLSHGVFLCIGGLL